MTYFVHRLLIMSCTLTVFALPPVFAENLTLEKMFTNYPQLRELVNHAWQHNLQLQSAEKNQAAAEAAYQASRQNWFPTLWYQSEYRPGRQPYDNEPKTTRYANTLNFEQPIWDAKLNAAIDANKAITQQSYWSYVEVKNTLVFDLATAYFQLINTAQQQQILTNIIQNVKTRETAIQAQVELKRKTQVDLLDVKSQLIDKQFLLTQAQNKTSQAANLVSLIANKALKADQITTSQLTLLPTSQSQTLIEKALGTNPQLKELTAKKSELDYRSQEIAVEHQPELYLSGNLGYASEDSFQSDGESETWELGAVLKWEFGAPSRKKRLESADLEAQSIHAATSYLEQQIPVEIKTTQLQLQTIKAQIQSLESRITQLAEVYRIREERYKRGQSSITDLTIAEDNLLEAQISHSNAKAQFNIYSVKLWVLSGGD